MIDFRKVRFIVSAPSLKEKAARRETRPFVRRPEQRRQEHPHQFLCDCPKDRLFSSKKAGKDQTAQLLSWSMRPSIWSTRQGMVPRSTRTFRTINFAKMMEEYVKEPSLKAIVYLKLDLRHEPGQR
jgi:hypothetical protein